MLLLQVIIANDPSFVSTPESERVVLAAPVAVIVDNVEEDAVAKRKAEFRKKREQEAKAEMAAVPHPPPEIAVLPPSAPSAPVEDNSAAKRKEEFLRQKREQRRAEKEAADATAQSAPASSQVAVDAALGPPAHDLPISVQSSSRPRNSSAESLEIRPPSHPPPVEADLPPAELSLLIGRFLRAVQSGTRAVHGFVLSDIKDAFRAADDDGDGSATLLQLQAMLVF